MSWRILRPLGIALAVLGVLGAAALALDPRSANYEFKYSLYPPGGFSPKKGKAIPRPDPKQPKASPIIGKDGKFTDFAQWFYAIGSDAKCFEKWWYGYFTDKDVWKPAKSPVFEGTAAGNQGHRIIAWLGNLKKMVDADAEIDAPVKSALGTEDWKRTAEATIRSTINAKGMLEYGGNKADMACVFHFIRTKFGSMGLKVDNIYTLDRAQDLIGSLLTEPWIINAEDRYVDPPDHDYLESIGRQYAGKESDIRIVKDGRILYTGGLFIGWKQQPSLHGTWDGLSIINSLFKYYPDPDPASPKSIFYKWNRLPPEKREIGRKMIVLCSRRLWLDWLEKKGPTWCWVRDGKPTDYDARPSEAPLLSAYDGYGDNQFGWAKAAWDEMFGNPTRNTNDGVQALLAIAHGRVHRDLRTPVGQQVPGRYEFDPAVQKKQMEEDQKRLGVKPADLPQGVGDDGPRLDPNKERPGSSSEK